MRVFKKGNWSQGGVCPICKTDKEGEVVLVGVVGTQDGYNMEAEQFHVDCLDLVYDKEHQVLFQKWGEL